MPVPGGDEVLEKSANTGNPGYATLLSRGAPLQASIGLTEFTNAFSKTRLPIVPTTRPGDHPLSFLPSRTTTTSISVKPSG